MVTFTRVCATMTASGEGKDRVERLEHQVLDIVARLEVEFGGVNAEDEGWETEAEAMKRREDKSIEVSKRSEGCIGESEEGANCRQASDDEVIESLLEKEDGEEEVAKTDKAASSKKASRREPELLRGPLSEEFNPLYRFSQELTKLRGYAWATDAEIDVSEPWWRCQCDTDNDVGCWCAI